MPLPLASFKLRFFDRRVRIVPAEDEHGASFAEPGVDLVDADADAVLGACGVLLDWFHEREPGVVVRALSFDLARGRVLASLEDGARPRVLRIEDLDLLDRAAPVAGQLGELALAKLRARRAREF